ncbi:membrane metallo-endopeptidase-like 1 [Bacillus rossius redtenbacheri]|uniref:membrane metallo-endopeptidase-like 1 n=1 Tax=Bacillus rossius redtenbacheri TaxID=93214 RepID=UPI002FDDB201
MVRASAALLVAVLVTAALLVAAVEVQEFDEYDYEPSEEISNVGTSNPTPSKYTSERTHTSTVVTSDDTTRSTANSETDAYVTVDKTLATRDGNRSSQSEFDQNSSSPITSSTEIATETNIYAISSQSATPPRSSNATVVYFEESPRSVETSPTAGVTASSGDRHETTETRWSSTTELFAADCSLDELLCPSRGCRELSGRVLSLMDHGTSPCADFHRHACGGLGIHPELLERRAGGEVDRRLREQILSIKGSDNTPHGQLKKFYDSCLEYKVLQDRTERIREVLAEVKTAGRFMASEVGESKPPDLTDLLLHLFRLDSSPLFDILLDKHETNSSKFVLKLIPPTKKILLIDKKGTAGEITSFEKVLLSLPDIYGPNSSSIINETLKTLREDIMEVIEKYTPLEDYLRWTYVTKKYEVMTVENLQLHFTMVNWVSLLSKLLNESVDSATEVYVYSKSYLEHLFHYLSEIDARALQDSLLLLLAQEVAGDPGDTGDTGDRGDHCLAAARDLLPDVAASLYLRSFPEDTAARVRRALDQARRALGVLGRLDGRSLPGELGSLRLDASGGRDVLRQDLLRRRMQGYEISNNYLTNTMNLRKRKRHLLYTLFNKNASAEEQMWTYFASPMQTQELLLYNHHTIVVSYAALPTETVGAILPQYRAAELGFALARLLARHLDHTGLHYGPNGTKEDIVSADIYQTYLSDAKRRTLKKVSKLDKGFSKHRRSRLLLANDFATDEIALDVALKMFKSDEKNRKELQLFFLAMAQTSCQKKPTWDESAPLSLNLPLPWPVRVNAVFAQSPQFSAAFGCSGMGASHYTGVSLMEAPPGNRTSTPERMLLR